MNAISGESLTDVPAREAGVLGSLTRFKELVYVVCLRYRDIGPGEDEL